MTGERIAHYQILEQLGRGGMGVVYRATDTKLGRQVALKFLPDVLGLTSVALDRFIREARSAASLNHPHICTIYEIGEHAGRPFIAMELLQGRTLGEQIGGRPLPIGQSVDIALQVASALDAAHSSGIIHRDIKPANIFVTTSGLAKILDFGLAKSLGSAPTGSPDGATTADEGNLTGVGSTLGTIAYMSPEQARGEELDGRSDIFSLGLVLYEMVTGHQAFAGETTAVIFDGILNRTPRAPSEWNSDVAPDLERILAKSIEKDRDHRYQRAADLANDLRHIKRSSDSGLSSTTMAVPVATSGSAWPSSGPHTSTRATAAAVSPPKRRSIPAAAVAAGVALLVIAGAGAAFWQMRGRGQALAASDRILIADFGNTTGDQMFDGTLRQALAVKLEESPFLNVVADQRVRETLAFMSRPPNTPVTSGVAREICQRQGIKAVMLGDIATLGSSYVVTLTAENCQTGDVLAREQVSAASKEQVLGAVGTAAAAMRERLGESLASIEKTDKAIGEATTSSLEALKAFSIGDEKRNTGSDQDAIPFLRRAIELDPTFALAHARLGTVYSNLGEAKLAIEERARAYELRDRVSERERFYITAHYHSGNARDIDKALETYDLWKQAYPRDPVPYINSGLLYAQRGDQERALQSYIKGIELDPMRRVAYGNAISKYLELNRLDDARALMNQQIKYLGETPETQFKLYEIASLQNDTATVEEYGPMLEKGPMEPAYLSLRSAELAYRARPRESLRLGARSSDLFRRQGLAQRATLAASGRALVAAMFGLKQEARQLADELSNPDNNIDVAVNLAFAYAKMGEPARARKAYAVIKPGDIPDPTLSALLMQELDGLLMLGSGRAADALQRLQDLPDSKHSMMSTLLATRGEAALSLGRWADAERDFREAVKRKTAGFQYNLAGPFAHFGLAHALAAQNKTSEARDEYRKLFEIWTQPETDNPLVQQARAEAAKLGS